MGTYQQVELTKAAKYIQSKKIKILTKKSKKV